jgi:plastocyanin
MPIRPLLAAAVLSLAGLSAWAAGTITIDQQAQTFSQKSAALKVGDSITFANHDDVTHNIGVFGEDDDGADLGLQKPGEMLTYKFDKAGRFKVRCSIHPSMKMTVTVN